MLFSIVAVPIYIPTSSAGVFAAPSPAFVTCRLFTDGHSECCEVQFTVGTFCVSLIIIDVEHLFMSPLTSCIDILSFEFITFPK